jgi:hypothetical protein
MILLWMYDFLKADRMSDTWVTIIWNDIDNFAIKTILG